MLNLNWSTLLLQILNFIVMAFVLWRFLFKPVVKILDERSSRVTLAIDDAEKKAHEADEMRAEYEEKLSEAQEEAIAIHQRTQDELARSKKQLLEETREEISTMREKAQRELEESRQQAIYQHRRELGRLVSSLSARMMREAGGAAFQQSTIEQFIDQLSALSPDEYQQAMDESTADVLHVQLISAHGLDDQQMGRIEQLLKTLSKQPVAIAHKVDESLVAGATARFGDVVIDGSLAGQLQDLKDRYVDELEHA